MTSLPPLAGLRLRADGPSGVVERCHRTLEQLGATVGGAPLATMDDNSLGPSSGLPGGTLELAASVHLATEVLAAHRSGQHRMVEADRAATMVWAPTLLGQGLWHRPSAPQRTLGGGWVCADLAAGDDRQQFDSLLAVVGDTASAETLAREGQAWRLAITPYRHEDAAAPTTPPAIGVGWGTRTTAADPARGSADETMPGESDPDRPLNGVTIVDLSIMWAGPLATRILADLGARVQRVEPACRRDGMRDDPSGLFDELAQGKSTHDLDLREPAQRRAFLDLVADADVVLDAFSPRVRPNLGITRSDLIPATHNSDLITLSLPAFPQGSPMRSWVAYGTGVHAVSGLGFLADDMPVAPAVSYPDPIAGLTAALIVVALLTQSSSGADDRASAAPMRNHVEVPLLSALQPLRAAHPSSSIGESVDATSTWFNQRYRHV